VEVERGTGCTTGLGTAREWAVRMRRWSRICGGGAACGSCAPSLAHAMHFQRQAGRRVAWFQLYEKHPMYRHTTNNNNNNNNTTTHHLLRVAAPHVHTIIHQAMLTLRDRVQVSKFVEDVTWLELTRVAASEKLELGNLPFQASSLVSLRLNPIQIQIYIQAHNYLV
jgi:hypothetical protein